MLNLNNRVKPLNDQQPVRWNPNYRIVIISPNEIYVTHGLRSSFSFSIEDEQSQNILPVIVELLQEPISRSTLLESFAAAKQEAVIKLVDDLYGVGIVIEGHVSGLPYSVYFKSDVSLPSLSVGLIGAGPLGITQLAALLSLGIGNKFLIAEGRNLQQLSSQREGLPLMFKKYFAESSTHHAFKEFGKEWLPAHVDYHVIDNWSDTSLRELMKEVDLTIIAVESFLPRLLYGVNAIAHEEGRPFLSCFTDGGLGIVGPLVVPGETACFNCFGIGFEASMHQHSQFRTYRTFMERKGTGLPLLGVLPLFEIVSGFCTDAVARFVFSPQSTFVLNRALFVNLEALEIDVQDILKHPGCPVCSQQEKLLLHPTI